MVRPGAPVSGDLQRSWTTEAVTRADLSNNTVRTDQPNASIAAFKSVIQKTTKTISSKQTLTSNSIWPDPVDNLQLWGISTIAAVPNYSAPHC